MEAQVYFKHFVFILDARDCQTALISSSLICLLLLLLSFFLLSYGSMILCAYMYTYAGIFALNQRVLNGNSCINFRIFKKLLSLLSS